MESFNTVCNLCSIGCTIGLTKENDVVHSVAGKPGLINSSGVYCDYPEQVYIKLRKKERIIKPLIREDNNFKPISWEAAFDLLKVKVTEGMPEEKAFFAGARLTNEEQYLIQKLCRVGAYSNDIGSFHYLGRGTGYTKLSKANIPFFELSEAKRIIIIGAEVTSDYPVAGHFIFENATEMGIPVEVVTNDPYSVMIEKSEKHIVVDSYFHFIKAVNHYLLTNELQDHVYINNLVDNFTEFNNEVLGLDYEELIEKAGCERNLIEEFALRYLNEPNAVIVFSENQLSSNTCGEIFNLALITGKHGRRGAGLLLLKEKNNSHGLHDMGAMSNLSPGATSWEDPFQRNTVQLTWGSKELPSYIPDMFEKFVNGNYRSLFIFGEDPVGCAYDEEEMKALIKKSDFVMVQDHFLTDTTQMADLVLPASFPFETGGTFTNSQRVIQKIDRGTECPLQFNSWQQINEILTRIGFASFDSVIDITFEMAALLPKFCTSSKLNFRMHNSDNQKNLFRFGCDALFGLTSKQSVVPVKKA